MNPRYAVPVLANVPVVQYGEGDFSYQGMRGLASLGHLGQVQLPDQGYTPYIAAAVAIGLFLWLVRS